MRALAAVLLLAAMSTPGLGGHGALPLAAPPLDPGGLAPWPAGWEVQARGVAAVVAREEFLLGSPLVHAFDGTAETWAPCDPFSFWNGLEGRWFVRPRAADGTPFAYFDFEAWENTPGLGGAVAFYAFEDGACRDLGWQAMLFPTGVVRGLFPPGTTHLYAAPSLPGTAGVRSGPSLSTVATVEFCRHANCFIQPGETPGFMAYRHPSPNFLGLPSAAPVT